LADALLDVMGTKPGRLQIEEAGLPTVVVPTLVAVWAASNPDEEPGPLEQTRLQLADRFDLRPAVVPPGDAAVVLAILRGEAGGGDVDEPPLGGGHGDPAWPDPLLRFMADFYLRAGLGSLRALQAWRHAAAGLARHGGRRHVVAADVRRAARLTLRGRLAADAVEAGLRGLEAAVATGPGADAGAAGAGADAGAAGAGADAGAAGAGADAGAAGAGADAGAAGAGADAGAAGSGADAGAAGAGADAGSAGAGAVGGRGPRPISAVSPLAAPEWTGQSEAAE